jgi:hypothetical protein
MRIANFESACGGSIPPGATSAESPAKKGRAARQPTHVAPAARPACDSPVTVPLALVVPPALVDELAHRIARGILEGLDR